MPHTLNFIAGWWLILAAFVSGAVIGLGFHREEFLGGYGSFRRRLLRLGQLVRLRRRDQNSAGRLSRAERLQDKHSHNWRRCARRHA